MKRLIAIAAMVFAAGQVFASKQLETFNFASTPSNIPGLENVGVVGIFWDDRCVNVNYVVDNIPANPGTPNEISPQQIRQELQASFSRWNQIPTSYINMNVVAVRTLNNGPPTFDFINELAFETDPGAPFLAASPSVSLQSDTTFVDGDDIDGDGDSDVFDPSAAGRNSCFDFDRDGDIEFPAGNYKAGTILENDVMFNQEVAWSLQPGDDDLSDIQAIATHEFGHSHGLAHSFINQTSPVDGNGATMFPFINITNGPSEAATRTLHNDDIASSSIVYKEGSARSGPAALQRGDRAFNSVYGLISGEIKQSGVGVAGASVSASSNSGERIAETYSGNVVVQFDPATGDLLVIDAANSIVNGRYILPVPLQGALDLVNVSIEALDGSPAAAGNISITAQVGDILGQQFFEEETLGLGPLESNVELLPGLLLPTLVVKGLTSSGNNLVTNDAAVLRNSGPINFIGTGRAIGATQVIYAERFANADVLAQLQAGSMVTSAQFHTEVADSFVVPKFKRASLMLGVVNADGTVTLDPTAIFARNNFVGQDDDLAPLYLSATVLQNFSLRQQLQANPNKDVFAVLQANDVFDTGSSGLPPLLAVSLQTNGNSFFSRNGGPLARFGLGFGVQLNFSGVRQAPVPTLVP
jgi:hypothetical protein